MGKKNKKNAFIVNDDCSDNEESKYSVVNNKKRPWQSGITTLSIPSKKKRKLNSTPNGIINGDISSQQVSNDLKCDLKKTKKSKGLKNKLKLNHVKQSSGENILDKNNNLKESTVVNSHEEILKQKQNLPIYDKRYQLLKEIKKSPTTIIIGETGSGKTTQIPQFLYEEHLSKKGKICITQPRRVAAITIAKRVAAEMNSTLGPIVGYSVRFEDCCTEKTKIKYVTDGMLLREALTDNLFYKYQWIILDEAHERSINTDILFGIVKSAQKKRKQKMKTPLNVIVMSATMNVDHFSSYFDNAPVVYVEGRQHPVEIFVTKNKFSDYYISCLSTMLKIHKEAEAGEDILIFLTGQEEIDSAVKLINHIAKDPKLSSYPTLKAYPLYAALPHSKQLNVFNPKLFGQRKVIVSTNIAETSVTIPGVRYVIDCGHAKIRTFNSVSGFDELKVCKISQAQAWQRTGRAGREAPGTCYRIYTDEEFQDMKTDAVPEILRANLASVILRLLGVGVKKILKFDFIDKPTMANLMQAKTELLDLKAINYTDGSLILTAIGKKMAIFPLEPQYSKLLLNAVEYECSEEILILISILSSESILVNPSDKKEEAKECREKFRAKEGDHLTFLNIFNTFLQITNTKAWCKKNYLNYRNLCYAAEVRRQLKELCSRNQIPLVSCGSKPDPVLKCLISALYKNVAEANLGLKYRVLRSSESAQIHPSSTLFGRSPEYVLFTDVVRTEKTFMHINSEIKADWLMDINSDYFISKHIRKTSSP